MSKYKYLECQVAAHLDAEKNKVTGLMDHMVKVRLRMKDGTTNHLKFLFTKKEIKNWMQLKSGAGRASDGQIAIEEINESKPQGS